MCVPLYLYTLECSTACHPAEQPFSLRCTGCRRGWWKHYSWCCDANPVCEGHRHAVACPNFGPKHHTVTCSVLPADPSLRFSHTIRSRQLSEAAAVAAHRPTSPAGAGMTRPSGPAQLQDGPEAAHAAREAHAEGAASPVGPLSRAPQGSIALLADRPPSPPETLQMAAQLSTAAAFFAREGASPTRAQQAGRQQQAPVANSSQRAQQAGRDQQVPGVASRQGTEQTMQELQDCAAFMQMVSPLVTQQAGREQPIEVAQRLSPANAQESGQQQKPSPTDPSQRDSHAAVRGQQQQLSPAERSQRDSHATALQQLRQRAASGESLSPFVGRGVAVDVSRCVSCNPPAAMCVLHAVAPVVYTLTPGAAMRKHPSQSHLSRQSRGRPAAHPQLAALHGCPACTVAVGCHTAPPPLSSPPAALTGAGQPPRKLANMASAALPTLLADRCPLSAAHPSLSTGTCMLSMQLRRTLLGRGPRRGSPPRAALCTYRQQMQSWCMGSCWVAAASPHRGSPRGLP